MILFIKGDKNDAEYTTSRYKMTSAELEKLMPVIIAIRLQTRKSRHNNWDITDYPADGKSPIELYKDILTQDQIALFSEYCPSQIHTIDSIEYFESEPKILL